MTVPSLSENIDTLEQLASSGFSWGLGDGFGSDYLLFQTSPVSIYKVWTRYKITTRHKRFIGYF